MHELRVTLEMNTPALAGGSEPRSCDPYFRMRPSAIRGGLRHWFRAAAASLLWPELGPDRQAQRENDDYMVKELAALEACVFGETERQSSFLVLPPEGGHVSSWPLPRKNEPGITYLGYGVFDRNQKPPQRLTAPPGQPISLRLCFRRTKNETSPGEPSTPSLEVLIPAVAASLWLWTAFGGCGARWRRGFGSMRLASMTLTQRKGARPQAALPPDLLRPLTQLLALPRTNEDHLKCLKRGIGAAQDAIVKLVNATTTGHTLLRNNGVKPHPNIRTIDGIKNLKTLYGATTQATDALEAAGAALLKFRSSLARPKPLPDYDMVKASIPSHASPPKAVIRAAFGLPLGFFFRSLGNKKTNFLPVPPPEFDLPKLDRVPSPLLIRVHALEPGPRQRAYGVTLINLAEKGTTPLLGCRVEQKDKRGSIETPTSNIINDFIAHAVEQSKRTPLGARPAGRMRRHR